MENFHFNTLLKIFYHFSGLKSRLLQVSREHRSQGVHLSQWHHTWHPQPRRQVCFHLRLWSGRHHCLQRKVGQILEGGAQDHEGPEFQACQYSFLPKLPGWARVSITASYFRPRRSTLSVQMSASQSETTMLMESLLTGRVVSISAPWAAVHSSG